MREYNGYKNYPTWNLKLWIDNDRYMHEEWVERAAYLDVETLAGALKEWFCESVGFDAGFASDIWGWVAGVIDFNEIAEILKDEASE